MNQTVPALVTRLLGRQSELEVIRAALADVANQGTAVVLHGDPGIGKSAVLAAGSNLASTKGFVVLNAAGSEAESHLPFAALHTLLRPLLNDVATLPDEHRDALARAFGLSARTSRPEARDFGSDRFFLGLAAVELVAAAPAPVLLVADDVHWWDPASRETLAFVARRIATLPAVLLSATRDTGAPSAPQVDLGRSVTLSGLPAPPARALLMEHGAGLSAEEARLVLEVAEGNPLALIELPVSLNRRDLGPWVPIGPNAQVVPLTSQLELAFAARLAGLRVDCRWVLLVAAALDGDRVSEILAAASTLPAVQDPQTALDDAVTADLVTLDGGALRFRHPLVRSAALQAATAAERRAVHRGLAVSQLAQPDRAAWHRALASVGPDEDVAAALELAAAHALERGAPVAAAGLFERAAALSVQDHRRGHRLLRAAELAYELGRGDLAERLIGEARTLQLHEGDRARLVGLDAVFDGAPGTSDDILLIVSSALTVFADGDSELGAYLLVGAARRCLWSSAPHATRQRVLDAALRHLPETDPRLIQITAFVDPLGRGADVVTRLASWAERVPGPVTGTLLGIASFLVADFDRTMMFVARSRRGLQQQGRTELLAQALAVQAMAGVYLGRFTTAHDAAVTAYDLTLETAQPTWRALATFALAHLEAVHGHTASAAALTEEAARTAVRTNNLALVNRLQLARGLNALGAGQPGPAFAELRRMLDSSDPAFQRSQAVCGVDYLAESATSAEELDEARALFSEVESLTRDTSARGVRQAVALARAMLAPDDVAEQHFLEASRWAAEATPWYRARLDLALGSWLTRRRRFTEAGRKLRSAQAVFRALDTPAWSSRAERELETLGLLRAENGNPVRVRLSAQELQVARRAARGLSNREIAEQLHLSTRTVASHLYRIFPKLGIHSRAQLHLVLADRGDP